MAAVAAEPCDRVDFGDLFWYGLYLTPFATSLPRDAVRLSIKLRSPSVRGFDQ
jgi:hypothetical protein